MKFKSTVYSLILSNILVIILAVIQKWDTGTYILTFWWQNIIIGLFNFIRIIKIKKVIKKDSNNNDLIINARKFEVYITSFFFILHYGVFHFLYLSFFKEQSFFSNIQNNSVVLSMLIFFSNHLFSYYKHRNEYEVVNSKLIVKLLFGIYYRIIPMHLIIVCGAFIIKGIYLLVVFLILKSVADVTMHIIEHKHQKIIQEK